MSHNQMSDHPLIHAAKHGDEEQVRRLLRSSTPSANSINEAVSSACRMGYLGVIRLLVEEGHARPNGAVDSDGGCCTIPLHIAAQMGREHVVRYLVSLEDGPRALQALDGHAHPAHILAASNF